MPVILVWKPYMYVDLLFSPLEVVRYKEQNETTAVVIDVLRASSTILYAFNAYDNQEINILKGAKEIIPVKDVNLAYQTYDKLKNQDALLAGEVDGFPPEGFHLGNSPEEFITEKIYNKTIIMATTNGTKTLNLMKNSKETLIGCMLNAFAVARKCIEYKNNVMIACAGRWDVSSLEDITAGGLISLYIKYLTQEKSIRTSFSDSAIIAMNSYKSFDSVLNILNVCDHGTYLKNKGLQKDLVPCSIKNKFNIVPRFKEGKLLPELLHPITYYYD